MPRVLRVWVCSVSVCVCAATRGSRPRVLSGTVRACRSFRDPRADGLVRAMVGQLRASAAAIEDLMRGLDEGRECDPAVRAEAWKLPLLRALLVRVVRGLNAAARRCLVGRCSARRTLRGCSGRTIASWRPSGRSS